MDPSRALLRSFSVRLPLDVYHVSRSEKITRRNLRWSAPPAVCVKFGDDALASDLYRSRKRKVCTPGDRTSDVIQCCPDARPRQTHEVDLEPQESTAIRIRTHAGCPESVSKLCTQAIWGM